MKLFLIALIALLGGVQYSVAEPAEKPTYVKRYYGKPFALGLVKPDLRFISEPTLKFLQADVKVPKHYNLLEKYPQLAWIFDQGSCGSCVYNSFTKNYVDSLLMRGITVPVLSRQFAMDCAAGWSCSGSFFDKVAEGVIAQKGLPAEADYPYRGRDQSCKGKSSTMYSQIKSFASIDNSPKSIATALLKGYPVSVTVGADNEFMGYGGGIYNGCSNAGTNHQVLVYGLDCETSVDAEGNCVFDAQGRLPAGVGFYFMPNSWSKGWGEDGVMRIRVTSKSGNLCNNIAEEASIIETGIPMPDPTPPVPPAPTPSAGLPVWVFIVGGLGGLAILILLVTVAKKK